MEIESLERSAPLGRVGKRDLLWTIPVLLLIFATTTYCQTNMGILVGSVQDTSGAAIPQAKISVTNIETGVTTNTVTSGVGTFQVPSLVPGAYRVRAEAPGFQAQVRTGVLGAVTPARRTRLIFPKKGL